MRFVTILILALSLASCSGELPLEPVPSECTFEIQGACWTFLGLEGSDVRALAETPWGIYVGTQSDGVHRLDLDARVLERLGLAHAAVGDIVFVPGTPARLLVGMRPTGMETTPAAIYASTGDGDDWTGSDDGLAAMNDGRFWAHLLDTDPAHPGRVYWGTGGGAIVLRSDDAGRTWYFVRGNPNIFGGASQDLMVTNESRIWVTSLDPFGYSMLKWSDNGGESWQVFANPPSIRAMLEDPIRPDRIWAAGSSGVVTLVEGGTEENWSASLPPDHLEHPGIAVDLAVVDTVLFAITREQSGSAPSAEEQPGLYATGLDENGWTGLPIPDSVAVARAAIGLESGSMIIGTKSGVWQFKP